MSLTVLRVTTACLQTVNVIHCFEGHNCMFANSECHSQFAKHADGTLANFFNRLTTPLIWATAIAIMAKECTFANCISGKYSTCSKAIFI